MPLFKGNHASCSSMMSVSIHLPWGDPQSSKSDYSGAWRGCMFLFSCVPSSFNTKDVP